MIIIDDLFNLRIIKHAGLCTNQNNDNYLDVCEGRFISPLSFEMFNRPKSALKPCGWMKLDSQKKRKTFIWVGNWNEALGLFWRCNDLKMFLTKRYHWLQKTWNIKNYFCDVSFQDFCWQSSIWWKNIKSLIHANVIFYLLSYQN